MDDLALLRRLDADVEPDQRALESALAELTEAMRRAANGRRAHVIARRQIRRRRIRTGGFAALAAGVATVLALGTGFGPGATAEAATVLHRAADQAITTKDPRLGPGQFLKITTVTSDTVTGPNGTGWREQYTRTLYIPRDRSGTWYMVRSNQQPTVFFTPASKQAAMRWWRQPRTDPNSVPLGHRVIDSGKGGRFAEFDYAANGADGVSIADLPSDPHLLLAFLYAKGVGAGTSPNEEAMAMIADLLRTGLVPAAERASLLRAAALIPGVTVTDDQAVLDGRTGVAIGTKSGQGQVQDIVINPKDGTIIGERDLPTTHLRGLPVGALGYFTAVTTTVASASPNAGN